MSSPLTHYQRLKVAPDAPPEIIRAAYRVLAGRLHPDRQGGEPGPDDEAHAQMVALNAAYETLIDPATRASYDASLLPPDTPAAPAEETDGEPRATRVGIEWTVPREGEAASPWWPPSPLRALGAGAGLLVLGGLLGAWVWHVKTESQMDRALSDQYMSHAASYNEGEAAPVRAVSTAASGALAASAPVASGASASRPTEPDVAPPRGTAPPDVLAGLRRPTVEELSRMSDEELLKVLPMLDRPAHAPRTPAAIRAEAQHMLDGKPLRLRTEARLVDPLAPAPAASGSVR